MPLAHIGINVTDLAAAKQYFDELMPLIGMEPFVTGDDQFSYRMVGGRPATFIFFYPALEQARYSRHQPGLQHLAFMVKTRAQVHRVHEWAIARGAEIIHPPQEFPQYHEGYYATFWYGPDRFMLEVVNHRDDSTH